MVRLSFSTSGFVIVALGLFGLSLHVSAEENDSTDAIREKIDRHFEELDKDGDGRLSEEESREYSQKRLARMREAGVVLEFPMDRTTFINAAVAERENEAKRDRDKESEKELRREMRNPIRSDELESSEADDPNPGSPTSGGRKIPGRPSKFVRALPANYLAYDKNKDGQIGLYEWERAKYAEFAKLDKNGDGFLTPAELAPKVVPKAGPAGANGNAQDPVDREARESFGRLDSNRDSSMTEDEWAKSQRTRAMFEQVGIQLSLPADVESYVVLYRKAREASGGGRDFGGGGRDFSGGRGR
jgi:EF hand